MTDYIIKRKLTAEYIEREAAKDFACDQCGEQGHCNRPEMCPFMCGIDAIPAADVVARDCYDRILAENDTMRAQLAQIGKKPGDRMDDVRLGVYVVQEALTNYGVDVTKLWETATAQKEALDRAYNKGKHDACAKNMEIEDPYKPLWPNWED